MKVMATPRRRSTRLGGVSTPVRLPNGHPIECADICSPGSIPLHQESIFRL